MCLKTTGWGCCCRAAKYVIPERRWAGIKLSKSKTCMIWLKHRGRQNGFCKKQQQWWLYTVYQILHLVNPSLSLMVSLAVVHYIISIHRHLPRSILDHSILLWQPGVLVRTFTFCHSSFWLEDDGWATATRAWKYLVKWKSCGWRFFRKWRGKYLLKNCPQ